MQKSRRVNTKAEKRKRLDAEKYLADKMNISDRTVSKWERGVSPNKRILRNNLCLPACKLLYLINEKKTFIDRYNIKYYNCS